MTAGGGGIQIVTVGIEEARLAQLPDDWHVTRASDAGTALYALSTGGCVVVGPATGDPLDVVATIRDGDGRAPVVAVTDDPESALSAGATDVAAPDDPPELLARRVENAVAAEGTDEATVLEALQAVVGDLMTAPDRETVGERAVEATREVLGHPASGVQVYDPDADALVPLAWSERAAELVDEPRTYTEDHPVPWGVYQDGEPRYVPDVRDIAPDERMDRDIVAGSSMLLPLGDHGLFIVSSTAVDDFDADDRRFTRILASAVESAFDRLEHERTLTDLHEVATEFATASSPAAVYERTVEAATTLLPFDDCVFLVERDGLLEPVEHANERVAAASSTYHVDDWFAGRTYRDQRPFVVDDLEATADVASELDPGEATSPDHDYRSLLSVPVGDHGVFQAAHERVEQFDETDRELASVLASHAAAALSRLDSERQVREQRRNFEQLFDLTPAPVVHARFESGDPVVRNVNAAFAETFGVDRDDVVGEPVNDLVAPEGNRRSAERVTERVRDGESVEREGTRHTVDGERQFIVRAEPLRTEQPQEAIGVYVDITERSERERLLTALHEVATDIEACDTAAAVCERTVTAAEDLLAFDHCSVLLAEGDVLVPTALSEDMPRHWTRPRRSGSAIIGTVHETQEPRVVDDARSDPVADPQGPFRSAMVLPLGEHGVFVAIDAEPEAFDDTDRELAGLLTDHATAALDDFAWAEDVEAERERFAGLLDLIDDPVVHAREAIDGPVVIDVNEAFETTFGFDADTVAGRSLNEFIVPDRLREEAAELDAKLRSDSRVERQVTRRTVDGEREFRVRLRPLDSGSEAVGIYEPVAEADGGASTDADPGTADETRGGTDTRE